MPIRLIGAPRLQRIVCLLLSAAVFLSVAGCNTLGAMGKDKRKETLEAATTRYQAAIRWGYFEAAYELLDPKLRDEVSLDEEFKGIRVVGYDKVQGLRVRDDDTALQVVEIQYVRNDTQVMRSVIDRQIWKWDEDKKTWWLESLPPKFNKPAD